jgi:hypothetical protein
MVGSGVMAGDSTTGWFSGVVSCVMANRFLLFHGMGRMAHVEWVWSGRLILREERIFVEIVDGAFEIPSIAARKA